MSNAHIYYTFNDGGDRWCKYIKLANESELQQLSEGLGQKSFDSAWPIGITYIQFPGKNDPNKLFNYTMGFKCYWEMLNFNGAFFRSEGAGASQFGSGIQGESLPNISGQVAYIQAEQGKGAHDPTGPFTTNNYRGNSDSGFGHDQAFHMYFDASRCSKAYQNGAEVKPKNYTIRIWERKS